MRTLEKEPGRRYQHASEIKTDVEMIGGLSNLSPQMRHMYGYEYRSPRQIFGWPLVHIAKGIDPKTGRKRVATSLRRCLRACQAKPGRWQGPPRQYHRAPARLVMRLLVSGASERGAMLRPAVMPASSYRYRGQAQMIRLRIAFASPR